MAFLSYELLELLREPIDKSRGRLNVKDGRLFAGLSPGLRAEPGCGSACSRDGVALSKEPRDLCFASLVFCDFWRVCLGEGIRSSASFASESSASRLSPARLPVLTARLRNPPNPCPALERPSRTEGLDLARRCGAGLAPPARASAPLGCAGVGMDLDLTRAAKGGEAGNINPECIGDRPVGGGGGVGDAHGPQRQPPPTGQLTNHEWETLPHGPQNAAMHSWHVCFVVRSRGSPSRRLEVSPSREVADLTGLPPATPPAATPPAAGARFLARR
mmetsp:Transcript_24874/g.56036  ORF Transcript_24874/g.56036 Transcript_24874/m.56036 type:complete len:274 (-) Transcript_24874:25-846(-)